MNREFLKGLGLDDEAVNKAMAEHGKSIESHKAKNTDLANTITDLQGQITQRDTDLTALKKDAKGSEELQTKLSDLQKQYDEDKSTYETKIKDTQLNSALKLALAGKVHDTDIVSSLINRESIELGEDGNVTKGLSEQIKSLKESKAFLFVAEDATPSAPKGVKPVDGDPGGTTPGNALVAKLAKYQ